MQYAVTYYLPLEYILSFLKQVVGHDVVYVASRSVTPQVQVAMLAPQPYNFVLLY